MSDAEFNTLGLNKFSQYQFYQRINVWAYLGYYQNNHLFLILSNLDSCSIVSNMLMIDSLGKCKDMINIGFSLGDAGFEFYTYTKRINDSTFIAYDERKGGGKTYFLRNRLFTVRKDSFFNKRFDTLLNKELKN